VGAVLFCCVLELQGAVKGQEEDELTPVTSKRFIVTNKLCGEECFLRS
jgi:hypothetical protein